MATPASHNINNWHWTEKDFTEWATARLKELLTFKQEFETCDVDVTVDEVKGEAFKYNRKNKIHMAYDYKCSLKWKFNQPGSDIVEGTLKVEPFVDDEMDDWEFEVRVKSTGMAPEIVSAAKEKVGKSLILPRIQVFVDEFQEKME